jgi:hypothetical protein
MISVIVMWRLMKEESLNILNPEILLHMEVVTVNFDHFHYIGYDWRESCVLKAK